MRGSPTRLARLVGTYRDLAVIATTSLLLLLVLNGCAFVWLALEERFFAPPPASLRYGLDRLAAAYPEHTEAEIEALLTETWTREYVYEPLVQHKEGPMRGTWVNVDAAGFRHSANQGPWPPAPSETAVFAYGGSTTFGYGVADGETIPSRLQEALNARGCERPARVYNFGRGNYYSEQERVLFGSHLVAGLVPTAAVFLDGLNEWKDEPKFSGRLERFMRKVPATVLWRRALKTLSLIELRRRLRDELGGPEERTPREDAAAYGAAVVERWLASRRLIAAAGEAFDVETLFVWQPVPTYQYELDYHLFRDESAAALAYHGPLQHGYALLDSRRAERSDLQATEGFLWLADIQVGRREPLYVDAAHYTAAFSRQIAERMAAELGPRIGCGAGFAAAQPE